MMARTISKALVVCAAATWLAIAGVGAAAAQPVVPPDDAAPLTAPELLQLYGGKTWRWVSGGAFFEGKSRIFTARTESENGQSTASGRWRINDSGRLCMEADWVTATGTYPTSTCFEHLQSKGDIYQRKLPDGGWYVFKHAVVQPEDEFNKLVREDLVSTADEFPGGNEGGV